MAHTLKKIALEARLKDCNNVMTLGVRPNFSDYNKKEAKLSASDWSSIYPRVPAHRS